MDETEDQEGGPEARKAKVRTARIVESYEHIGVEGSSAVIVVDVIAFDVTRASWRIVRRTSDRHM